MNIKRIITHPIGITVIYVVLGFCWIFFSDYLVSILVEPSAEAMRAVQTFKGAAFILVSALIIYILISSLNDSLKQKIAEHKNDKDRLSRAQHIGKMGDWSYDVERDVINWSDPVYNIYEIDPKQPIPSRLEMREFYPGEDRQRMEHAVKAAISEGKSYDLDTKIIVASGEKWVRSTGIPVVKNNKTVRIEGIIQDITERKSFEQQLHESKSLLEKTINSLDEAVVVFEPEYRTITMANAAVLSIFGYHPSELIGKTTEILHLNRENYEELGKIGKDIVAKEGVFQTEFQMKHKDGTVIEAEMVVTPIKDPDNLQAGVVSVARDITARKKAELEKEQLTERLKAIANNLPGAIFKYRLNADETDELLFLSEGSHQLWGITPEEGAADNEKIWSQIDERDLPDLLKSIKKSAEDLSFWKHEWRSHHPTLGIRWHQGLGQPRKANDNAIIWNSIILDITEQKMVQFEKEKSQQQLEAVANNLSGTIFQYIIDENGEDEIGYISDGAEGLFGVPRDEIIKDLNKAWDMFHPDDVDRVKQAVKFSVENMTPLHEEWRINHPEKGMRWLEGFATPVDRPDGLTILDTIILDITDRKEAEEKIREQEEHLELITENASDGILACDQNGKLIFFNKILREWIGYEDMSLSPDQWPAHYKIYSADGQRILNKEELSLIKALKYGKVRGHRFMVKAENQPPRHLESNGSALYDNNDNIIGAMVVIRDITDRITRELETTNAILEALDKERLDIASEIHDSVTQTLSIVSMNLKNLVLDNQEFEENAKFKKAQQFLQEAINQSRDLSHRIMPRSIEDFGLVASVEELSDSLAKAHDIKINVSYNREFRLTKNEEINIYRIVQEAIHNSIKHAKASSIDVGFDRKNRHLEVKVSDNGIGVAATTNDKGIGIRTMKNRALKLNAGFDIASDDQGTIVKLTVQLNE